MDVTVTALGAIIGLAVAIVLIIKKVNPAYSLMLGAVIGGLTGGASLVDTVALMVQGTQGMASAILRILAAGVLAGVLIESGAASKIAETIISKLGDKKAIFAIVLSTCILTAVGVFIDVAVITVAPIAMSIAKKANISKSAILLAMVGGGKSGNIISPNPNAIAASDAFSIPLTSVMTAGIIPAIFGIIVTIIIAQKLSNKGVQVLNSDITEENNNEKPSFFASILGPLVAIILLSLRPIAGIVIDPMIALPVGGIIGCLMMGKIKNFNSYCTVGLGKMTGVAILLIGTGTISGIIANSQLKDVLINFLTATGAPEFLLAPLAGILMSAATASTTSGTTVGSQVFGPTLVELGMPGLNAAAMIHSGATVLDHLPHGSFFHATGGSVNMDIKDRLKIMPYESLVGLTLTLVSSIIYGIIL
ncbi:MULTISPECIES: GntP family permease [Clostridium]|uniref:High-affinity gluconate transporter n=2 Tax=Clostridium TaxID=1485 RepID=A0A151ANV5_9CLOT|nr:MULTISPECIES: SLC13 family permease [Clostridium]KYH29312.1 high-affinity gluconate transporter [Clostridium colicanis DSM 13634]MBE6043321.1 GntP family permease [Clostridium thermopalmarium]PRR70974.1 High-affinity gluconate transporter [Clostridium thermopalmarium DSM 5974]PVZ28896.1 GntP family gluconate:H+ symporter [Clostridium thermopalmarium DSM 5974]